jgi:8-oxo-dGTP pyrophosphatase MutT (NUDIX family)
MIIPAFDPRKVPEVAQSRQLPPVPMHRLTVEGLGARFASPVSWQPEIRAEATFSNRPAVQAAVLIGIVNRARPTVLLTQRTSHLSTHAGQIAFPGGKVDSGDSDAINAALRETHEETGLLPHSIRVLGHLPIYTTGTNFFVTPVVGVIQPGFSLIPNAQEVEDVFEVPLDYLMNPQTHKRHELTWDGNTRHWYSIPYFEQQAQGGTERYIWGATAGMLRNLYHFLVA